MTHRTVRPNFDYYLGGELYSALNRGKYPMKIADEIRKCVGFVGHEDNHCKQHIGGTCFFVSSDPFWHIGVDYYPIWCVTARHVIEKILLARKDIADDRPEKNTMLLRLNRTPGGVDDFRVETTDWRYHDDPSVDVAVMPFVLDMSKHDHRAYPLSKCLTPKLIEDDNIGIGSDLFFVGLFNQHKHTSRNVPILRCGNIAAMPDEPVKTGMDFANVYLVESRSIGGLSGSPVFTYNEPWIAELDGKRKFISSPTRNSLMGLIHGHFDEDRAEPEYGAKTTDSDERRLDEVNTGIAMVTPVSAIQDVIASPRCQAHLRSVESQIRSDNPGGPVMD